MILTTCKYFDLVGNRCSRVTDGKCSDLQDCEFKYIAELKAENERLKKLECKFKEYCTCNTEKYIQTLQEIKAIVCGNYEIIDPQGRKDILKLITKAESEGKNERLFTKTLCPNL